jgi:hypothetical protein
MFAGMEPGWRPTPVPDLVCCVGRAVSSKLESSPPPPKETIMGKYLLAWLLGVPGIVLVLVYLFFH